MLYWYNFLCCKQIVAVCNRHAINYIGLQPRHKQQLLKASCIIIVALSLPA